MLRGLGIHRPRAVVAACFALIALLALLGAGVEQRLHRSDLTVDGTSSARAQELAKKHFGDSESLVVLLEGPERELDAQGRRLAAAIDRHPHVSVLGPWLPGAAKELRPAPHRALILVRADQDFGEVSEHVVPQVRADVDRVVSEPVSGHVTGYPDVAAGIHNASVEALTRAELLAAPLLLIVLLLVFRSPVAAALPLLLGLTTIAAARGVLDLVNRVMELDVVALNMGSMMGLALGIDYSLVLVSRFREELAVGRDARDAAAVAASTAGRTVLFAGIALIAAMVASFIMAPGDLLASAGAGVIASAVLSVFTAVVALPAALVLIGPRIDKWRFGRSGADSGWGGLALRTLRNPVVAAALVLGLVLALSAPALGLQMGSPDPRALPESSRERQDFQKLMDTMGGGWSAPYELVVAGERGRITDPERLRKLERWQERISRDRGVIAVMGPAAISQRTRRLDRMERGLRTAGEQIERGKRDQERLARGLARVDSGVAQMRSGLAEAASGARRLESGSGEGAHGARRLAAGLATARSGAERLIAGLEEARSGAGRLADGGARLERGSRRLHAGLARARRQAAASLPRIRELREGLEQGADGLGRLREPAQVADKELREALAALEAMAPTSKADPQYALAYESVARALGAVSGRHPLTGEPVQDGYDGLDAELAAASEQAGRAAAGVRELEQGSRRLVSGMRRLEQGAGRLEAGVGRMHAGAVRLERGLRRLERGGGELGSGLERLEAGSTRLASGARRLDAGASELAGGLSRGADRTGRLESGVGRMRSGVAESRVRTNKLAGGLGGGEEATRIFDSGYLTLAALDSAEHEQRAASTFAVNVNDGGDATRIAVIPAGDPSKAGHPLRERLERVAGDLAHDTGTEVEVGGPAVRLQDFAIESSGGLWLMVLVLVAVTYLVLVPVLRSLLLPLMAVILNVLTVLAAVGVLTVLFQGDSPPLGGAGDLDGIMVLAIFSIVFALSIDYEVFLLARMREGYGLTGTTEGAIDYGLRKTAGVITGAALIMTGVFAAFALADIASMRQLGIGLSTAVILDATVVRLVLLPALMKLAGRANWWLPGWLDRLLPNVDVEGTPPRPADGDVPAAQTLSTRPLSLDDFHPGHGNGDSNGGGRFRREREPAGA